MAVRPKRANPISTRPVYLPRIAAKQLLEAAKGPKTEAAVRVFIDGEVPAAIADALMPAIAAALGRDAGMQGPVVAVLAGRPQGEVRQAVASLGNELAWARVKTMSTAHYRSLPLRSEVDEEEAVFLARSQPSYEGVSHPLPATAFPYDASALQNAFAAWLAEPDTLITSRRLVGWDMDARRWVPVNVVSGTPAVISIAGDVDPTRLASELRRRNPSAQL